MTRLTSVIAHSSFLASSAAWPAHAAAMVNWSLRAVCSSHQDRHAETEITTIGGSPCMT